MPRGVLLPVLQVGALPALSALLLSGYSTSTFLLRIDNYIRFAFKRYILQSLAAGSYQMVRCFTAQARRWFAMSPDRCRTCRQGNGSGATTPSLPAAGSST